MPEADGPVGRKPADYPCRSAFLPKFVLLQATRRATACVWRFRRPRTKALNSVFMFAWRFRASNDSF